MSFQKITIVGNLTADPELKTNSNGNTFASLNIAVNEYISGRDVTTFFSASVFNGSGQAIVNHKLAKRGREIYIEGREQIRLRTRQDGSPVIYRDIMVDKWYILRGGSSASAPVEAEAPMPIEPEDEEFPGV